MWLGWDMASPLFLLLLKLLLVVRLLLPLLLLQLRNPCMGCGEL